MPILGHDFNLKRIVGKTKARSQMLLIRTDDGRLVEREVPVLSSCAVDDDLCAGYLVDVSNQYQDETTGVWYQIVDEKSTIPICLLNQARVENISGKKGESKKSQMESLVNGIFHHSWTIDLATIDREAETDKKTGWMYLILGIPVILCALILAMNMF